MLNGRVCMDVSDRVRSTEFGGRVRVMELAAADRPSKLLAATIHFSGTPSTLPSCGRNRLSFSVHTICMMLSSTVIAFTGLLASYVFLRCLQLYTHDPHEPPAIADRIPFISPLLGMAKQTQFYKDMRDRYNLPIYTLRLPGTRLYVVNSVKLITAVQHQVRVLDFAPVEVRAAVNVMGATPAGQEILNMDRNGIGKHSYAIEFDKAIHPALSPGANLDAINRSSVQWVAAFLEKLAQEAPRTVNLFEWTRTEVAKATSNAVYGPLNPFRDPENLAAFWKFEPGIVVLLLQVLPSVLGKESLRAREKLVNAFIAYFRADGHERGSALIQARYQHSRDYGVSLEDLSRFELGGAVAILTNTVPTAFWVLWHVISDATVLKEVRDGLLSICKIENDTATIDITAIKQSCPTLVSTLQEVLRFHGTGTSVRVVQKDHLLNGEYLLKKGGTLMIPGPVQHTSKDIYGENVAEFQHRRFVRTPGRSRLNPAGFRGFGGGSTLCPGRHFVSTEIIAFVALTVLRFDFRPVTGKWTQPTTDKAGMQATVPPPDVDVEVEMTLRDGPSATKHWKIILEDSDKALELVVEDITEH